MLNHCVEGQIKERKKKERVLYFLPSWDTIIAISFALVWAVVVAPARVAETVKALRRRNNTIKMPYY